MILLSTILIHSMVGGAEPFAKTDGDLIFAYFENVSSVGVGLPHRCYLQKQYTDGERLYLLIYRKTASWGSNFEMLMAVERKKVDANDICITSVLINEKDLRKKGFVRWLDDIRMDADKIQLSLAEYNATKLPTDVNRSWIELSDLLSLIANN